MDEIDRDELRTEAAHRIMGWHTGSRAWAYTDLATVWHDQQNTPLIPTHAWQPDADDTQTMQVLARMVDLGFCYAINGSNGHCRVSFCYGDRELGVAEHTQLRPALLMAAVMAMTTIGDHQDHPLVRR